MRGVLFGLNLFGELKEVSFNARHAEKVRQVLLRNPQRNNLQASRPPLAPGIRLGRQIRHLLP